MKETIPLEDIRDFRIKQLRHDIEEVMNTLKEFEIPAVLNKPSLLNFTQLSAAAQSGILLAKAIEELEKLK